MIAVQLQYGEIKTGLYWTLRNALDIESRDVAKIPYTCYREKAI